MVKKINYMHSKNICLHYIMCKILKTYLFNTKFKQTAAVKK